MVFRGGWNETERADLIRMARAGRTPKEVAIALNRGLADTEEMGQRFRFWIPITRRADLAVKAAPRVNAPLGEPIGIEHETHLRNAHAENDAEYVQMLLKAGGFWWNEVVGGIHVIWHGPKGQKLTPAGYARHVAMQRAG